VPQWFSKTGIVIKSLDPNGLDYRRWLQAIIWPKDVTPFVWRADSNKFLDGVAGASRAITPTHPENTVQAHWNFTDSLDHVVAPGTYRFCSEVANMNKIAKDLTVTPNILSSLTFLTQHTCGTFVFDGSHIPSTASISAPTTANILSYTAYTE
jgi:hypothetical protein